MAGHLLERDAVLTALRSALVAAGSGSGSTVLVHGEAGVGKTALRLFDDLGARPAAAWARARLRELGVTTVPRGPQRGPGPTRPGSPTASWRSWSCWSRA